MRINASDFINNKEPETKLYTKKGQESYIDEESNYRLSVENNHVYAKAIKNKSPKSFADREKVRFSYHIKSQPNKILYNPLDLYSIEPKISKSFINKICKNELMFIEVTESVFNKYLSFLRTENVQWLKEAQREIR